MGVRRIVLMALVASSIACSQRGKEIADEICKCHEDASGDVTKAGKCLEKQIELQKEIEGDVAQTTVFTTALSECSALQP